MLGDVTKVQILGRGVDFLAKRCLYKTLVTSTRLYATTVNSLRETDC